MLMPRASFVVTAAVAGAFALAGAGCAGGGHVAPRGAAGADGGAGAAGQGEAGRAGAGDGASAGGAAGATGDAGAPDPCPKAPAPLRASGVTLELSVAPVLEAKPFVFGEPNAMASGARVTPLNFRFYVSHVALLTAASTSVPVDLVTAAGAVEPYGVHLVNAEEPATQTLRVLAPAGNYVGLSFILGLDDACNAGSANARAAPLDNTSQLVWPVPFGYLFLRLEDRVDVGAPDGGAAATDAAPADADVDAASADGIPRAIHMGGFPGRLFAPTVTVVGALALTGGGAPVQRTLTFEVGKLFEGAEAPIDPASAMSIPFDPETLAGEHLRQHVGALAPFSLAP
jgi:hypothetical protein